MVLVALVAPTAYIILSFLSLLQFQALYLMFSNLVAARYRIDLWRRTVQPGVPCEDAASLPPHTPPPSAEKSAGENGGQPGVRCSCVLVCACATSSHHRPAFKFQPNLTQVLMVWPQGMAHVMIPPPTKNPVLTNPGGPADRHTDRSGFARPPHAHPAKQLNHCFPHTLHCVTSITKTTAWLRGPTNIASMHVVCMPSPDTCWMLHP